MVTPFVGDAVRREIFEIIRQAEAATVGGIFPWSGAAVDFVGCAGRELLFVDLMSCLKSAGLLAHDAFQRAALAVGSVALGDLRDGPWHAAASLALAVAATRPIGEACAEAAVVALRANRKIARVAHCDRSLIAVDAVLHASRGHLLLAFREALAAAPPDHRLSRLDHLGAAVRAAVPWAEIERALDRITVGQASPSAFASAACAVADIALAYVDFPDLRRVVEAVRGWAARRADANAVRHFPATPADASPASRYAWAAVAPLTWFVRGPPLRHGGPPMADHRVEAVICSATAAVHAVFAGATSPTDVARSLAAISSIVDPIVPWSVHEGAAVDAARNAAAQHRSLRPATS